jgi:hypothetical protein
MGLGVGPARQRPELVRAAAVLGAAGVVCVPPQRVGHSRNTARLGDQHGEVSGAEPDPKVLEFLAFEQDWLTGGWTVGKSVLTLLVPLALGAYCAAFWRRSLGWGLVVLNVMAIGKLGWGVLAGSGTGWAMTVPALAGLVIGDAAIIAALVVSRRRRRSTSSR